MEIDGRMCGIGGYTDRWSTFRPFNLSVASPSIKRYYEKHYVMA
jgi:hypothetical protein